MSIKPTKTNVLVAEVKRTTTTSSGIIIEGARSVGDTTLAKVLAVGSEVTDVVVGDKVLVTWNKAQVMHVDNEQCVLMKHEDIIGVVEE